MVEVVYIPFKHTGNPVPVLEKNISLIEGYTTIFLTCTSQHISQIDSVREHLSSVGKEIIGTSQILGCQRHSALESAANVDCFIHIGSGRFHPTILSAESEKPVFILNPVSDIFELISEDEVNQFNIKKKARLKKAAGANVFGILVSTKSGQQNLKEALELRVKLKGIKKKAYILAGNELSPDNLLPFRVDCIVNTACPRIVEDFFEKPILNPRELKTLFSL
jgi:2-(3-amino-3-carboxypropyl)histidine synthase